MNRDKPNDDEIDNELTAAVRALPTVPAPDTLREKLLQIPQQHPQSEVKAGFYRHYRKWLTVGAVAATVLVFYLVLPQLQPLYNDGEHNDEEYSNEEYNHEEYSDEEYSDEEIAAAKRELAVAFNYLSDISASTSHEMNHRLTDTGTKAVVEGSFYPFIH